MLWASNNQVLDRGGSGAGVSPSTCGISWGTMLWKLSPSSIPASQVFPRFPGLRLCSGWERGLRGSDVNAVTQMTRGKESQREREAHPKSWFGGVGELGGAELQRWLWFAIFLPCFSCTFEALACAVSSFEQVRGVRTCTPQTPIQLPLSANRSLAAKPINLQ